MTEQILQQDIEAHKGMASIVAMWLMRELPLFWNWVRTKAVPTIVSIYPYCRDNGGIFTISKSFFVGKQVNVSQPINK